jgi:hypothetical protein
MKLARELTDQLGAGVELSGRFAYTAGEIAGKLGFDSAESIKSLGTSFGATGVGLQNAVGASTATIPRAAEERARRIGDVNQENKITVNVQGGSNPQETGEVVKNGVKDALTEADVGDALATVIGGG